MESYKKNEPTNNLTKRHFASINSRIQNKYEQMQKKLEKSKSVDSLTGLNDSFVYIQAHKVGENSNQRRDEILYEDKKPPDAFKVIVEEIPVNATLLQEMNETYDLSYSETFNETERNIDKLFDGHYEYSLTTSTSLESLNTLNTESTEYEESLPPPSPPVHKTTIRDRIGSRIAAVKERRKDKKKESREKVEKLILSNTTRQDITKIVKKTKMCTVTIALIEATGLERDTTEEKPRMLFCRFRLGPEKYKSKLIKSQESLVKWQELFNINLFEENMLEISLWDKDIFLGRSDIDLSETEREKTHKMRLDLKGSSSNVQLFILLTISGVTLENIALDMEEYDRQRKLKQPKLAWFRLRDDYADVGCLSVFVYGGKGLSANDCYCVLQLNNDRLQTPTEFKTNDPNWMKIFTFTVTDITSILEVTIFEEKKSEIVGKISIPLLRINNGEKKWYALKDSTQRERAKGSNPRILLEMKVSWNLPRASLRVINPKEEKYLDPVNKLDRHIFARNLSRAKAVGAWIVDAFKVIKTCFEWESTKWNMIALLVWLVMCSIFRVWMLPLLLLLPFIWYRPENYFLFSWRRYFKKDSIATTTDVKNKNEKEEKTSLRQKINSLQEMVQSVQNTIGKLASYGESVKNLYNFTVPFLSFLTITIILVITLVMFLIPANYIFMLWGIHKFTRKILRPHRIPNNEILDLLSRVPDDEILLNCQELPLEETSEDEVH
ncbi:multiple C2 and transmembrane domain-containing protein-like isoform X1 [Cydia pomonella]|uniref:multiple C2 and transmembrane domain-containing protein-like isoform X1 n=1 Tax=Cydia pomonella TaxID=82600 RepID=UPI002ADE2522|nr:multiple C2 and transmembrane domain-containing protein-like isoform X1 [Cydia pomonella]